MLKLNHVQTKSYLKNRASTYNAPATKRERERIEKLGKILQKGICSTEGIQGTARYKLLNFILVERTKRERERIEKLGRILQKGICSTEGIQGTARYKLLNFILVERTINVHLKVK